MNPDTHPPPPGPLLRCAACGSRLLAPGAVTERPDGSTIVGRRCPECEHYDLVVADVRAVRAWLRHEDRVRERLHDLAELLTLDSVTVYA
jgi:hypothetical protein